MTKYLDYEGLRHFWGKIKKWVSEYVWITYETQDNILISKTVHSNKNNDEKEVKVYNWALDSSKPSYNLDEISTGVTNVPFTSTLKTKLDGIVDLRYGTCTTNAGTAQKTVTLTDSTGFALTTGVSVRVKFTNGNTAANPTLKIGSTTAKTICKIGTTKSDVCGWQSGEVIDFVYDGTNWIMIDGGTANGSYYGVVKLSDSISDSTSNAASGMTAATPKAVYDALVSSTEIIWINHESTANQYDNIVRGMNENKLVLCRYNDTVYMLVSAEPSTQEDNISYNYKNFLFSSLVGGDYHYLMYLYFQNSWTWGTGTVDLAETNQIPTISYDNVNNKIISTTNGISTDVVTAETLVSAVDRVFWATFGTTTATELVDAVTSNKIVLLKIGENGATYDNKNIFYLNHYEYTNQGSLAGEFVFSQVIGDGSQYIIYHSDSNGWQWGTIQSLAFETRNHKSSSISGTETSGSTNYPTNYAVKTYVNSVLTNGYIPLSQKGQANGVCPLDSNSKVDSQYLPSYVDDVVEVYDDSDAYTVGSEVTAFGSDWLYTKNNNNQIVMVTPEKGKIYVIIGSYNSSNPAYGTTSTSTYMDNQYRWGGSQYVKLNDGGMTRIIETEIDTATSDTSIPVS